MDDELKQYLESMEARLIEKFQETLHDTETRLLRGFADYQASWDARFTRLEVSDTTLNARMTALENRMFRLENPEAK